MTDAQRIKSIQRFVAAFGILLFAVTWKLWTPQTDFPQIPFFSWLVTVPGWIDWAGLLGIVTGLCWLALSANAKSTTIAVLVFMLSAGVMVSLNQHRLQPWVYLLLIYCGYMATLKDADAVKWVRWTVASIYVFSAISKLDYQFVFTVGQQMLQTLGGFVGFDVANLSDEIAVVMVLALPIGELLIGVALLVPRLRIGAGWLAIVLHGILILLLGPLGLNHHAGVLIWNCFFIVQAWFVFVAAPANETASDPEDAGDSLLVGKLFGLIVVAFPVTCLLLPTVELPVCADHWVAWEVYAPRSSRASATRPDSEPGVDRESGGIGNISIDQLSLEALGVPVYPQARFQAACLLKTRQAGGTGEAGLRHSPVFVSEVANRWTGQRQTVRLDSKMAVDRFRAKYWLNIQSRSLFIKR